MIISHTLLYQEGMIFPLKYLNPISYSSLKLKKSLR